MTIPVFDFPRFGLSSLQQQANALQTEWWDRYQAHAALNAAWNAGAQQRAAPGGPVIDGECEEVGEPKRLPGGAP